jgi:ribosomal protein S12 methylthiotransferase accessory factor
MSDIEISFPGGKRVDARVDGFVVHTDQPIEVGGDNSEPSPYDLFLASLATCAGIMILTFCQARDLSTEGLRLNQVVTYDPATRLPTNIRLELLLPESFPEKYRAAVLRAAANCKVKRTIHAAPTMDVVLSPAEPSHVAA